MIIKNIFKHNNINADMVERDKLNKWNEEQYENLKVLLQSDSIDEKITSLNEYKFFNKKKAFEKITGESYEQEKRIISYSFLKYAAAASILLAIAFTFLYFNPNFKNSTIIYASNDVKKEISLPDETIVTLDNNTDLVYSKNREVTLNGRAHFNVTKDTKNPFVIITKKGKITVLGTRFTVWTSNDVMEVAVEEGKVKYDYDGRSIILEHNQWMKLVNNDIVSSDISSGNQFSWQQQSLSFKDTPIDIVLSDLSRHYGFTVKLSDSIKKKPRCLLTSSYKNESLEQVLLELKTLFNISVVKKTDEYVITAINC